MDAVGADLEGGVDELVVGARQEAIDAKALRMLVRDAYAGTIAAGGSTHAMRAAPFRASHP